MKKLIMFFVFLLVPVAFLVAQEPVEPTTPPTGWSDILLNPGIWLASFAGVSLLTAFITAFLNGLLKVTKKFYRQLVAWGVAIVILVVCDLLNLKICYAWDFPILLAIIHGVFAGLASNGWADIPTLKSILKSIEGLFVKQ